jgi:hypothetical protein
MPTTDLDDWTDRLELALQDTGNARWSAADLAEAIRKAVEEYSLVDPNETVTEITLTAAGREVDISALTGRLRVTRAWWPYTSSDPEYPPNWVDFEEWGDVLFLSAGAEPEIGDVVRVWYVSMHQLEGLAGATATTLPDDAQTIILTGAAGYAAKARAAELPEELNIDSDVVKRLQAYADGRLADFKAWLAFKARQNAARVAGIAPAPRLDRWDTQDPESW